MSFLKKLEAIVIGTASATAWLGAELTKDCCKAVSDKVGRNGSITGSSGRTYTAEDFNGSAKQAEDFANNPDSIVQKGFNKAKELWNEY